MANAFGDYAEDQILGWVKGTSLPAAPATLYLGLLTALPGDSGSAGTPSNGTEVTAANGYARVAITSASGWSAISTVNTSQRHITNAATISFPAATGSWGTVVGWALYDAATLGNLWFYGSISPTQAIASGMTPSFPAGPAAGCIDIALD